MGLLNRIKGVVALYLLSVSAFAADFTEITTGLELKSGLIDTYVDHKKGKVYLALDKPDSQTGVSGRYIYVTYLNSGLGSNPVGLDRSASSGGEILRFQKIADKMVAFLENTRFRASADNPIEKKAVENSFATSLIWSAKIAATDAETGKVLIDISSLLTRDTLGISSRLEQTKQGNFKQVKDRSLIDTKEAHAFPVNLEFDAWVTFSSGKPGREVRTTTPDPKNVTLITHTTFMKLPDDNYKVRGSDERAPLIDVAYTDMSAPLAGDTVVRMARRFRLEKDASGKVIKPIVWYVDNGAPEPIRSALLEGANWWAKSFDAAGYKGGFRAEILPEGVHHLDARYNVITWVHRATRGWSWGNAIHDPRTGETLRGFVALGSLRVRQDIKIFEGLAGAAHTGDGSKNDPVKLALKRIRQLAAHEVGHPLGFAHNMGASSYGAANGESVMDYPAPLVTLDDKGELDFTNVYGVGTGKWDDWAVKFLYGDYPEGKSEAEAQQELIVKADAAGLRYVMDPDSRSVGAGHPKGSVWDTGHDAVASLKSVMAVRAKAVAEFGTHNLRKGESYSALQTKIVPLYLYHRYQLAAAAKTLGGIDFLYRHEGDGRPAPTDVSWSEQEAALEQLLATLDVSGLDLSDEALMALSPSAWAYGDPQFNREKFDGKSGPLFDHMKAVSVAADMSFSAIMHPSRLNRIHQQSIRMQDHPGLKVILFKVVDKAVGFGVKENLRKSQIRQVIKERLLDHISGLLYSDQVTMQVRAAVRETLLQQRRRLSGLRGKGRDEARQLIARMDNILARANTPAVKMPSGPAIPPGSPIGSDAECWHCDTSTLLEGGQQ